MGFLNLTKLTWKHNCFVVKIKNCTTLKNQFNPFQAKLESYGNWNWIGLKCVWTINLGSVKMSLVRPFIGNLRAQMVKQILNL